MRPAGFAVALALSGLTMAPPALAELPMAASAAAAKFQAPARPVWIANGDPRAALSLIELLETSKLDALNPKKFKTRAINPSGPT